MHVCQDVSLYVKFENDGQLIIIQPLYIKHYTCIWIYVISRQNHSINDLCRKILSLNFANLYFVYKMLTSAQRFTLCFIL